MVDYIFRQSVQFLYWVAEVFGTTYEMVNVVIFCVILPTYLLFTHILYAKVYIDLRSLSITRHERGQQCPTCCER